MKPNQSGDRFRATSSIYVRPPACRNGPWSKHPGARLYIRFQCDMHLGDFPAYHEQLERNQPNPHKSGFRSSETKSSTAREASSDNVSGWSAEPDSLLFGFTRRLPEDARKPCMVVIVQREAEGQTQSVDRCTPRSSSFRVLQWMSTSNLSFTWSNRRRQQIMTYYC
jgi:hypothetical protein